MVGYTYNVSETKASVRTIIDSQASIAALISSTRDQGTVRGTLGVDGTAMQKKLARAVVAGHVTMANAYYAGIRLRVQHSYQPYQQRRVLILPQFSCAPRLRVFRFKQRFYKA